MPYNIHFSTYNIGKKKGDLNNPKCNVQIHLPRLLEGLPWSPICQGNLERSFIEYFEGSKNMQFQWKEFKTCDIAMWRVFERLQMTNGPLQIQNDKGPSDKVSLMAHW